RRVVLTGDRQSPRRVVRAAIPPVLPAEPSTDTEPKKEVLRLLEELAADAVERDDDVVAVAGSPADMPIAPEVRGEEVSDRLAVALEHPGRDPLLERVLVVQPSIAQPRRRPRERDRLAVRAVRELAAPPTELLG